MQILRVTDKLSLAFGLTWEGHDAMERSLHAQVGKWRDRGFVLAASYVREGDSIYGLSNDRTNDKNKRGGGRLVSGAAVIATHPTLLGKTGLVIIEVEQGSDALVIVVGLRLGVVVLDRLAERSQVNAIRHEFAAELPGGVALQTWGKVVQVAAVDHEFNFDELVNAKKLHAAAQLKPLRSTQPILIGSVVAGLALVSVVTMVGWNYFESEEALAKTRRLASQNSPSALYTHEIEKLLVTPINPVGESIAKVKETLKDFPVLFAGWQLEKAECTRKSCTVTWVRQQGTFNEFKALASTTHPEWENVTTVSQVQLRHQLAITLPERKIGAQKTWPTVKDFTEQTYARWQYLQPGGWKATLSEAVQQALPVGLPPDKAKELAAFAGAPMGIALEIFQQSWWYASVDALSPVGPSVIGETVALNGPITVKYDGKDVKFDLKGTVYVQP